MTDNGEEERSGLNDQEDNKRKRKKLKYTLLREAWGETIKEDEDDQDQNSVWKGCHMKIRNMKD